MTDAADRLAYLALRADVDELHHLRRLPVRARAAARLAVATWDDGDVITLDDLLAAALAAIARSREFLSGATGVALADDPIPFTFHGELVGVAGDRIWLVVKADGRRDHA